MRRRAGLGPLLLAMIITAVGMILGISHFASARAARVTGIRQADYIQARYLAQAGLHRALLALKREHQIGQYGWSYPANHPGKFIPYEEFSGTLEGGRFEVVSVEPLTVDAGRGLPRRYAGREYRLHDQVAGHYDIFRITARGTSPGARQTVTLTATVKLVRLLVKPTTAEEP